MQKFMIILSPCPLENTEPTFPARKCQLMETSTIVFNAPDRDLLSRKYPTTFIVDLSEILISLVKSALTSEDQHWCCPKSSAQLPMSRLKATQLLQLRGATHTIIVSRDNCLSLLVAVSPRGTCLTFDFSRPKINIYTWKWLSDFFQLASG